MKPSTRFKQVIPVNFKETTLEVTKSLTHTTLKTCLYRLNTRMLTKHNNYSVIIISCSMHCCLLYCFNLTNKIVMISPMFITLLGIIFNFIWSENETYF